MRNKTNDEVKHLINKISNVYIVITSDIESRYVTHINNSTYKLIDECAKFVASRLDIVSKSELDTIIDGIVEEQEFSHQLSNSTIQRLVNETNQIYDCCELEESLVAMCSTIYILHNVNVALNRYDLYGLTYRGISVRLKQVLVRLACYF